MSFKNFVTVTLLSLCSVIAMAQSKRISGKITDTNGEAVIGAAVQQVGSVTNGVITDADGNFAISVPDGAVMNVESLGYDPLQFTVESGRSVYNITLNESATELNETVVIGYGVQQKKLLTGSTIQVKGDNISKLSTTTVLGALQSQSPGVQITQNSGQPGKGYKVNIRGLGTVGDAEPLYVIDGVAGGSLTALNPADIESIDVLKDAASAAIYGARAANGVILVTTKHGQDGRATISYDGYYGWQYIAKMPNTVNAKEYMEVIDLIATNEGQPKKDWASLMPASLYQSVMNGSWNGTNWMEESYNKGAPTTNHSITVTGGNRDSSYSMGLSYTAQEGILGYNKISPVNADFQRYTFRMNSDNVIIRNKDLEILKVGETINYNYNSNSGIAEGNIYWNSVHNILISNPLLPAYTTDAQGNITGFYDTAARRADGWNVDATSASINPLAYDAFTSRGLNTNKSHTLQASAYAQLQPVRNLKFKTQFGYVMSASSSRSYDMSYDITPVTFQEYDEVSQSQNIGQRFSWENTLSYAWKLGTAHNFDAVVGQSIEKWGFGESVKGKAWYSIFPNDYSRAYLDNTKPVGLNQISVEGKPRTQGALASFFGRINYNYDSKYLLSAVLRADGSSNFARGHRWGYFPSVSAGWVISSEPWMANTQDWLSFLKLRASWGRNGNASISNFQYLSTIKLDDSAGYPFSGETALDTGAVGDVLANPEVSWETSQQTDIGLDARFFGSRLGIAVDGYIKDTKDWLVDAPIASVYGLNAPYINGGNVRNTGVEFAIDWSKNTGEFNYGINLNGSFNKNKVTRIANAEGIIHGDANVLSQGTTEMYRAQVGYPIGFFWGYKTAGVFQNESQVASTAAKYPDAKPGDLIIVDTDGDGDIDTEDRTMIGDPNPHFNLGLNFWLAYKGFDFSVSGYGAFGQQIAKSYRSFGDRPADNFTTEFLYESWKGEGTSNRLPILTGGSNRNWLNISDIYIEDGDYFRISNVTLGYDFSQLIRSKWVGKCRLYVAAQNLYTFTKYSGMDPEIGYGRSDWCSGIDLGFFPSPRTFLVGINLQF